jgi:hypothetical protein
VQLHALPRGDASTKRRNGRAAYRLSGTYDRFEAFKGPDGKPTTASNAAFGFAPVFRLGQSSGSSGLFGESFEANYGEAAEFEYTS